MKDQLLEAGSIAIKHGEKIGVDAIEVYLEANHVMDISVEGGKLRTVAKKNDYGCGIRVICDKRLGFSYTTSIDPIAMRTAVENSYGLSRISSRDDDFVNLLEGGYSYPSVPDCYDEEIQSLTPELGIDIIMRSIMSNREHLKEISPINFATLQSKDITRVIVNSNDLSCATQLSSISMFLEATIRNDGKQANSWDEQLASGLSRINPEQLGREVAESVIGNLDKDEIEGGIMPVVLSPVAVGHLLSSRRPGSLASALNHLEVQKMTSYVVDMIGCEVASSDVELIDDPLLAGGISSRPFDAERFPSRKNELIHDGVLLSYLHNSYSANKAGLENTGNAWRRAYSEAPTIAPSNLILKPGQKSESDMISVIDRGVYCQFTGDLPNPISGDLTAIVMEGYLIEEGEKSHALENTMFSINMLDLLKSITFVGSGTKVTDNGIFPSILVEGAVVTSGKS